MLIYNYQIKKYNVNLLLIKKRNNVNLFIHKHQHKPFFFFFRSKISLKKQKGCHPCTHEVYNR